MGLVVYRMTGVLGAVVMSGLVWAQTAARANQNARPTSPTLDPREFACDRFANRKRYDHAVACTPASKLAEDRLRADGGAPGSQVGQPGQTSQLFVFVIGTSCPEVDDLLGGFLWCEPAGVEGEIGCGHGDG